MVIPSQKNTWIEKPEAVKVRWPRSDCRPPQPAWKRVCTGVDVQRHVAPGCSLMGTQQPPALIKPYQGGTLDRGS